MDFTSLVTSINKISLISFFITLGVLGYEVYLLKKESQKKKKPKIPEFEKNAVLKQKETPIIRQKKRSLIKKPNNAVIAVLISFLIVFGLISALGLKANRRQGNQNGTLKPTVIIQFISSKGIKIFDKDWKELADDKASLLKEDDRFLVGIDKPADPDIDMARIRINENKWKKEDITLKFRKDFNIFYKEFTISTGESKLKIEAQLHSKSDGWLGD